MNKAPKQKFAAVLNHVIPLAGGDLSLSTTYAYIGSQYYSVFNDAASEVDSYDRVDGRVSYYDGQDRFEIHGYVRNALDDASATGSASSGAPFFGIARSYNAPRTIGAELRFKF